MSTDLPKILYSSNLNHYFRLIVMHHKDHLSLLHLYCRFAFVTEQTTPPPHDKVQNIEDTSASFENGVTTVRFCRVRDTGDVNDYSLTYCIFFLYAWGGDVFNTTTGAIAYHGLNRRNTSESPVCIPISRTFCPDRCKS